MNTPIIVHKINDTENKQESRRKKQEMFYTFLGSCKEKSFTGYIKINFSQGIIGRIDKFEEMFK